ncbi:MAG: MmcQ/YjbR family DNA-binding protein, partial [Actinobacteria bacterium]|nr:MmcQ/YjbR family DNA-binding protein [Actinomycetota bacterium]
AVESDRETFEEIWWGKRLTAVRVNLRRVERQTLAELLSDAWEGKAPKRLLRRRS